ncbi:SLC13 family permease [Salinarimonas sp.]|uniref:SLC13 family permease n=1 Tax=Salinarimonas sp. TaxID=2766526 RepID=UPI00391BAD52
MAALDVLLVIGLVVALASGRVPTVAAFTTFVLAVALSGRLPFADVVTLLADPALVAVVCLALFSSVVARMAWIRRLLFARGQASLSRVMARFLGITAAVSSVVPNTAVVGAFMGPAANHPRVSPHVLLMPLSYMALAAGMLTPFGTSANLIVVGQAARSDIALGPLDFLFPGLAAVGAVFATLVLLAPRFLREPADTGAVEPEFFHIEATIPEGSPLAGRTVLENRLRNLGRFFLAEVMRGERVLSPVEPTEVLAEGDVLVFVGDVRFIEEIASIPGLVISDEAPAGRRQDNILHAVVAANSSLVGATLKEANFRSRFDASVFAIRRGNQRLSGKLGQVRLEAGDLLVFAAGHDFAAREDIRGQLHVVETKHAGLTNLDTRAAIAVSAGFGVFLLLAFTGAVPFALAAMLLLAFAVGGGFLPARDVKRNFPFELVIVLWGSLTLGTLIARSGLASAVAESLIGAAPGITPVLALALVFATTWALTELLSNVSAALVALPIGIEVARLVGVPPEPFALVVAFGASASFLVPFGYQTHLMVMTPGGYSFFDFTRLGAVVLLAYGTTSVATIAALYF